CGGGFPQAGMAVGDLAVATGEIDAQLGIESEIPGNPLVELPFSIGTCSQGSYKNRIPMDEKLALSVARVLRNCFGKVQIGPFITVSTITATDERAGCLYEQFGATMESMEGSAGAQLACHYGIPFVEIRSAGNLVGKRDRASWNLPAAFEKCTRAVSAFLADIKETDRNDA
ncbi:MAG: futalosine hydrolase, partial [Deltaproteobacteria bacterium]|nr:futalosine hydrolase [Deltaproteobacteria bacterium]